MPGPIPAERLVAGRELTEPRLSPGGELLALVESTGGVASIVLHTFDGAPPRQLTAWPPPRPGRGLGGGCFAWSGDGSAVVYTATDGDLWWQPVDGGAVRRLTRHEPKVVQAPVVSADGRIAYVVDQAEVWVLDLHTRDTARVDDGRADFCFDPWIGPDGVVEWQAWNVPDMPWDGARIDRSDGTSTSGIGAIQQPRRLPDGTPICVRDDTGWSNVWCGEAPLVDEPFEHAGPSWGPGQRSYAWSPDGSRVAFSRNERGFGRLCVVDVATGEITDVGRAVHGQLSWEGGRLAALRTGARTPTQVVVYDTDGWERTVVAIGPLAGWEDHDLVEPELVEVAVPTGVVPCRLYRANGDARGMLTWVHGGPTDQWPVSFLPRLALWRSRGWHVLVPDHRGSTGHGRAHQQALHGAWGEADVADVAAVVAHAHRIGLGTPASTVVIGGSAGGFTALGVARRHPELVVGVVAVYPVTDLADLAVRSHRFEAHYTVHLVGPLPGTLDLHHARSPLHHAADLVDTPLLLLHGDSDPVVPLEQTVSLAEAVRAAGGDVELVVFPGEGHGFRQPLHQLEEIERIASFLDRVVG
jgi:dipeptidyl aminopeptidase/acylaminoacyl peptidase